MMYLPQAASTCQGSRQCAGSRFFIPEDAHDGVGQDVLDVVSKHGLLGDRPHEDAALLARIAGNAIRTMVQEVGFAMLRKLGVS
jgi:hypothetical protein